MKRRLREAELGSVAAPVHAASDEQTRAGEGLDFTLTPEQGGEAPRPQRAVAAVGSELPAQRAEEILSRVRGGGSAPAVERSFALPPSGPPAPRPGRDRLAPFPPTGSAQASTPPQQQGEPGPLEVLRFAPEGEVPVAPRISITFSQPMVPISSLGRLGAQPVPARLRPEVAGHWEWLGTRTLVFTPDGKRLPMATAYEVEIPAGVAATTGARLPAPVRFRFATPPPTLERWIPAGDSVRLEPVIVLVFDQPVDPASVLAAARLDSGKLLHRRWALRLASRAEVEADPQARAMLKRAREGHAVALRPEQTLPPATRFRFQLEPGVRSQEGPRPSTEAKRFSFRTYGPLRVVDSRCGWGGPCRPGMPLRIELSNAIDTDRFDRALVHVQPEVADLEVEVFGDAIVLRGRTEPRTSYTVTLEPALRDVFGQTLGRAVRLPWEVGGREPAFVVAGDDFLVTDPAADPAVTALVVNYEALAYEIRRVRPRDWAAFVRWRPGWNRDAEPPGERVRRGRIEVEGQRDQITSVRVPLREVLDGTSGQFVIELRPLPVPDKRRRAPVARLWVQVSPLAVTLVHDDRKLVAFVTRLADGRPVGDAEVAIVPDGIRGRTRPDGTVQLPLPDREAPGRVLTVRHGDDRAMLPAATGWLDGGAWTRRTPEDVYLWWVTDDRGIYRPGETAYVKGWVRRLDGGLRAAEPSLPPDGARLRWVLSGPRGNEIARGERELGALGGFDLALAIPEEVNLGQARLGLELVRDGATLGRHSRPVRIEAFRRPEYEVQARVETPAPHVVGDSLRASVQARYYAGGALPDAPVRWRVRARAASYAPPGHDDFSFGTWLPWWRVWSGPQPEAEREQSAEGRTDRDGVGRVRIALREARPPRPYSLEIEASVQDVNRQSWSARTRALVHPAKRYVGIRADRPFAAAGEAFDLDFIVTTIEGALVPDVPIELEAARLVWRWKGGVWQEEERDVVRHTLRSGEEPVRWHWQPDRPGRWRIRAVVRDAQGRANRSERTLWVGGGSRPPGRRLEREELTLIPDRRTYAPGDTAKILVLNPYERAEGLLTVARAGIVQVRRFHVEGSSITLEVPIRASDLPDVHVRVDLVGETPREDAASSETPSRPAFASGTVRLDVPPRDRSLAVRVAAREPALAPGGRTTIDLEVRDAAGRPAAGSHVLLLVVDEAVLALTGHRFTDPLGAFYPPRGDGLGGQDTRAFVWLAGSETLEQEHAFGTRGGEPMAAMAEKRLLRAAGAPLARMAMADRGGAEPAPITARVDLRPLALFAPDVVTDEQGRASVPLELPDSLTRYRIVAVAVHGATAWGKAESQITARLPLMVRPSPPRFLHYGDRAELPVVVQNQTAEPLTVDVAARVDGAAELDGPAAQRVQVAAGDRVELRFAVRAHAAGRARLEVAAIAGPHADAAELSLPVWTPATTEAFATYGVLDDGAAGYAIEPPEDAVAAFGGLEVQLSSTQLQALTDAVLYLTSYPYECAEQIASRVLAIAALKDVLAAFDAEGLPEPEQLVAAVRRDLKRLRGMQRGDGGFGFWEGADRSWPFVTIHVGHAIARAQAKGFRVPPRLRAGVLRYLREIRRHLDGRWSERTRWSLEAYALLVRALLGEAVAARANELVQEAGADRLPLEAVGWLLAVIAPAPELHGTTERLLRLVHNRVEETAGTAHFVTSYGDEDYLLLHSNRRADAVLLDALMTAEPKSDLIVKVVRGLLAHRTRGRWSNTQENAWVLLALDRYFRTYERVEPDFVARVWLGDRFAGEHRFEGRSTERWQLRVPLSYLLEQPEARRLLLHKQGAGRLYYRIGLRYAPRSLQLAALERGFSVARRYEAVDDPTDVQRQEDGSWRIRAGARVRVRLQLVAPGRRTHVALVDALPAGLEPLNPALAVTERLPARARRQGRGGARLWWWGRWYEHDNLRDERVEVFTSLLPAGVYEYSYIARATTPGVFTAPPPKAEQMYAPETFGRGPSDRVVVE
ncbi:MAG: hypothetical protein D6776_11755 [Planctomycetota bacterium]|nr:MAG: hypothetical protein D6776_11755 [Planctomycetota bacterium]